LELGDFLGFCGKNIWGLETCFFAHLWAFFEGGLGKWRVFLWGFCGEFVVECVVKRGRKHLLIRR
jgi:hypothetical protein